MCNRDERGPAELHYQSSICPHPYHKFHVDEREKTLRPSILFFHILGFESGHRFCKELRHRVDSKVREYEDIWLFLNVLQQVYKRKKDIPPRYYGDPQSTSNYLMFCDEDIQDPVSEQLKHYASPKGAHKQLHLFTHWFEYVDLGKELQAKGHTLRDVMITYTKWRERYQKTVPLLVGDMAAWTHVKYSPTWYSLVAKNRRIKRDVPDS